jgi:anti-sigma B factor antagonist
LSALESTNTAPGPSEADAAQVDAKRAAEMFSVECVQMDGFLELRLKGEIDMSNVTELSAQLEQAQSAAKRIVIDLSLLDFIDSSGLRALIDATENARLNGHALSFRRGGRPEVRRILEITGLDQTLPFV